MRRAFIVTALMLELEAVQSHLTYLGSVSGEDGSTYGIAKKVRREKTWRLRIRDPQGGVLPPRDATRSPTRP